MLAIQQSKPKTEKCVANILPCRIHHNGPAKVTKRYWSPTTNDDLTKTSYFRGRKLRGRVLKLPARYQGSVVRITENTLPHPIPHRPNLPRHDYDDDEDEEKEDDDDEISEPLKIVESLAEFDEMIIWNHDHLPASDDVFVKSIQEWIGFAEAIHGWSKEVASASEADPAVGSSREETANLAS